MKTIKNHIIIATIICIISISIYTIFQFISLDRLLEIGNNLESILGIKTEFSVDNVRAYIITLTSGIFISTIVALIFYLNEFRDKKENAINRFITINQDICKKYSELTYIAYTYDTELGKLAINYYLEYYDNKYTEYIKKIGEEYISQQPKSVKRVLKTEMKNNSAYALKYEKQNLLLNYLKEHPNTLAVGHGDNEHSITPKQKLSDIVNELDYKLDLMLKTYQDLMNINLNELLELEQEVSHFFSLNRKQICVIQKTYDDVIKQIGLLDYKLTAKKIYSIHHKSIEKIKSAYSYFDISECAEYEKKCIIDFVLFLQPFFISNTYIQFLNSNLEYNNFMYIQNALNQVLKCKKNGYLTVIDKNQFIFTRNEFEDGYRTHVIFTNPEELYGDIYK